MTYDEAIALINEDPQAMYYVEIGQGAYLLAGATMRGFILPSDEITTFKRF